MTEWICRHILMYFRVRTNSYHPENILTTPAVWNETNFDLLLDYYTYRSCELRARKSPLNWPYTKYVADFRVSLQLRTD